MKVRVRATLSGAWAAVFWTGIVGSGCVVEKIDAIIAEHGVTYWPSSSDGEGDSSSTSSGTSTSTSTSTGNADSSADGSASLASSTSYAGPDAGDTAGGSSTGPIEPVCGDGVVEGDEACDDGNANPDDGCKECAKDSIVFISSESYQGYKLGGLHGADQRCRSLAAKAGLLRPETFRAWLSTTSMSAADRLVHSRGRYKLVNGLVVAQDWASLTSGNLLNTITVDETSQSQDSWAWTGTLRDGQPALGSEFCGDWDNFGVLIFGGAGRSLAVDAAWSFFANDECGSENRLYCFEN